MRRFVATLVIASAGIAGLVAQARPAPKPFTTWTQYAGGAHSSQFTALDQINKTTVSKLAVAWTYPVGDRQITFNPIVVDGVMYVQAKGSSIVALDPATGKELWNSGRTITSFARAGLSASAGQVYLVTFDNTLYAFGIPMEH